jgi:predicted O-methyltransferase YrrM
MQTIETKVANVDGWLNRTEGRLLFRLAKQCTGRGAIVEIGSWKGKSTIWLAHGSREGSQVKIHAIDPHTGSPEHQGAGHVWTFTEFQRNIEMAGVQDLVVPHVDFSEAVARTFNEPVEMIFIDGLHEYEGVKTDFDAWFPKVTNGGTVAFHDTTCWPGVLKVVKDCVFKSRHFRKIRFANSVTCGQKVAQNTALERLGNHVMLGLFLIHAFLDRFSWRLLHKYLDFPITRILVARLKRSRVAG